MTGKWTQRKCHNQTLIGVARRRLNVLVSKIREIALYDTPEPKIV